MIIIEDDYDSVDMLKPPHAAQLVAAGCPCATDAYIGDAHCRRRPREAVCSWAICSWAETMVSHTEKSKRYRRRHQADYRRKPGAQSLAGARLRRASRRRYFGARTLMRAAYFSRRAPPISRSLSGIGSPAARSAARRMPVGEGQMPGHRA